MKVCTCGGKPSFLIFVFCLPYLLEVIWKGPYLTTQNRFAEKQTKFVVVSAWYTRGVRAFRPMVRAVIVNPNSVLPRMLVSKMAESSGVIRVNPQEAF